MQEDTDYMKKLLAFILALCLCLSLGLSAFASGEASGGASSEGIAAARASDSSYPSYDKTVGQAAISVDKADIQTANDENNSWTTFAGTLEVASSGHIKTDSISGVKIVGADFSGATEDTDTDNGIALSGEAGNILTVGGWNDFYQVPVGGKKLPFNSVIVLTNEETVDDTVEGNDGVGILMDEGNFLLDSIYIETDGMRAPAIYNMNNASTIVTDNCFFLTKGGPSWHPLFTLLTASSRAALLFGGETYFYNDSIVTQDWGCLSQESRNAGTRTYSVNSYLEAYRGGYGAYVLNGNYMDFYGSEIQATDYAIFLCGGVEVNVDNLDAALAHAAITANMEEYGIELGTSVTGDGRSLFAGNINAIVVHTNGVIGTSVLNVKNSVITTDHENGLRTTGVTGEPIDLDISYRWTQSDDESDFNQGEGWFAMQNMWGSAAVIRSMDSELTFDNTEIYPSNGVLIQSVVTYDPLGGTACLRSAGADERVGNNIHFKNGVYTGDILDQDYQRQMTVTLENATLTGSIQSYTMQMWNDLWATDRMAAQLTDAGLDPTALTETRADAIRAALIKDESYDGADVKLGVNLTVDKDSVWNCTGTSSLATLTIADADGLVVDGSYTIYENCGTDSTLSYYDTSAGTVVESIQPGVTYHDVVIVVE